MSLGVGSGFNDERVGDKQDVVALMSLVFDERTGAHRRDEKEKE